VVEAIDAARLERRPAGPGTSPVPRASPGRRAGLAVQVATAGAEASAVQTALLVVRQADDRRHFERTLAPSLAEAASDGGDVQATFDAIQPPDHRADLLRGQLDELLDPAVSALTDLRTAACRGDLAALPKLAAPLHGLGDKLNRYQQAHQ
jgi:hypothetical protein